MDTVTLTVEAKRLHREPVVITLVSCNGCGWRHSEVVKQAALDRLSAARKAAKARDTERRLRGLMRRRENHHPDCHLWRA